jgi:integrin alpha FG-GAP repeat containing protein 1
LKGAVVEVPNILNVVPGDFNYDGKLDILVSYSENNLVSMQVHFGTYAGFESQFSTVSPQAQDQPLVLDANADLIPDMFGTAANGSRAFWVNDGQGNFNM